MSTITEMRVHMCCEGCEEKIRKSLEKIRGVDQVEIDMAMQMVTVTGGVDQKKILKIVRRTGRRAELSQFPYNPEVRGYTHNPAGPAGGGPLAAATAAVGGGSLFQPSGQPCSSYNYYKHGYDGDQYSGYTFYNNNRNPTNSSIIGGQAGDVFSDENPHGCSVM